jgi:hypothetical protein
MARVMTFSGALTRTIWARMIGTRGFQPMPRPPAELRKLEDEERRRARAHRRLVWRGRLLVALWLLGGIGFLIVLALLARLAGFSVG